MEHIYYTKVLLQKSAKCIELSTFFKADQNFSLSEPHVYSEGYHKAPVTIIFKQFKEPIVN